MDDSCFIFTGDRWLTEYDTRGILSQNLSDPFFWKCVFIRILLRPCVSSAAFKGVKLGPVLGPLYFRQIVGSPKMTCADYCLKDMRVVWISVEVVRFERAAPRVKLGPVA